MSSHMGCRFQYFGPRVSELLLILLLTTPFLGANIWAQESPTPVLAETTPLVVEIPDPKPFEEKLKRLEKTENLDPVLKTELSNAYNKILNRVQKADEEKAKAEQFRKDLQELPGRTEEIQKILSQPPVSSTHTLSATATLSEMEKLLIQKEAELAAARTTVAQLDQDLNTLPENRKFLSERLASSKEKLKRLREEKGSDITEEMDPHLVDALKTQWQSKEAAFYYEIQAMEAEIPLFELRTPFLTLSRDLAIREIAQLESEVESYQNALSEMRKQEAERAAAQARLEARALLQSATADPAFKKLAESLAKENAALAELRTDESGTLKEIEKANRRIQTIETRKRQVTEDFARMRKRVEVVGLDNALGPLLRKYRAELPNFRQHYRNVIGRQTRISEIEIMRIDLREKRDGLANLEAVIKEDLATVPTPATDSIRQRQEQILRDLRQTQKEYIENLRSDYSTLWGKLDELNSKEHELAAETERFAEFVNENILWIPSGNALSPATLTESLGGFQWFFLNGSRWRSIIVTIGQEFRHHALLNSLAIFLFLFLVVIRPRIIGRITTLGKRAEKKTTAKLHLTFRCLFQTSLLALTTPAVVCFLGWRLSTTPWVDPGDPDFVRAFGFGLLLTSLVLVVFNSFRFILMPKGLAISHFDWPEDPISSIKGHLRWLTWVTLPTVIVYATLQWYLNDNYQESFGRLLFIINMLAVIGFGHKVLRLQGGAFQNILDFRRTTGRNRFRHVWYAFGVGIPLVILILAFLGYYYTALRLVVHFFYTLAFTLFMTTLYGVILRWVLLERRDLAMDQARKRRDQAKVQESDAPKAEIESEEGFLDLAKIDLQTKQLVKTLVGFLFILGLWFIWEEELPALSMLDRFELWDTRQTEVITDENGEEITKQSGELVTLTNLILALLIGLVSAGAIKNLPGLFEMVLLKRLAIGAGERYALTTIVRYIILATGLTLTFNAMGFGWRNLQWLVAAVGLGLGFGLQEIFANFVSGIILLFERPIRVGDTVTIGGINGTVLRINIRATTIVDFDRKELVVPNKEFVTGQLINWSLSDPILRQIIPVGIAYGSDTQLAYDTLLRISKEETIVLGDPKPQVIFHGFGASSLDFELRVFVRSIDDFINARHILHMAIDREFRKAGIEIAFPQQDLHVRSLSDSIVEQFKGSREKQKPEIES